MNIASFVIVLAIKVPLLCSAQEKVMLSEQGISPAVIGVMFTPERPGKYPAVILLHGSAGWRPDYAVLAKVFADSGFISVSPDYYAVTGMDTSQSEGISNWPIYQQIVRNTAKVICKNAFSNGKIGLVGFSRGAFLAVSVASSMPEVKAVVDFFGGGGTHSLTLDEEVKGIAPVLILHGESDTIVPISYATNLRNAVLRQGGKVEMVIYPGVGHGYISPTFPQYTKEAASDSFKRTLSFLREELH